MGSAQPHPSSGGDGGCGRLDAAPVECPPRTGAVRMGRPRAAASAPSGARYRLGVSSSASLAPPPQQQMVLRCVLGLK